MQSVVPPARRYRTPDVKPTDVAAFGVALLRGVATEVTISEARRSFVPKPKRDEHGKLTHDPLVFPTRTGKRAGEPKKGMGYASALRVAMTRALGLEVPETEARTRTRRYQDGSTRKMTYEATVWRTVRKPKGREITLLQGDEDFRPLNMHTMRRGYASGLAMAGWSRAKMRTAGGWATDAMPARYDLSAQHEQVDAKGTTPALKLVRSQS